MSFFQTAPCPESNYHSCLGRQGLQLALITEPPLPAVSHVAHLDSSWRCETFREAASLNICKAVLLLFCAITKLFTDFQWPPYGTGGNVNSSECVLRAPLLGREPVPQLWARCPLALSPQSLTSLLFHLQGPNSALNVLNHLINPPLLRLSNWPYFRLL